MRYIYRINEIQFGDGIIYEVFFHGRFVVTTDYFLDRRQARRVVACLIRRQRMFIKLGY
jgi:hypothetical protein